MDELSKQKIHERWIKSSGITTVGFIMQEIDLALANRNKELVEIVKNERVHFWGTPELEKQTKINNTVVDNILNNLITKDNE